MRKTLSILLILFFAFTTASAQAVEYSESAAYQPREIKPKKPKKEKKAKDDSKQSSDASEKESKNGVVGAGKPLTVPVSVYGRDAKFVRDLKQSDFRIFVDGREQEISAFEINDEPLSVVLLIDTSPSIKNEEIQNYALAVVEQFRPQDKFLIASFNQNFKVLNELTGDRRQIGKAIRGISTGNGTALYDALQNVFKKQIKPLEGRKAIVLLTDGVDTTSVNARYDTSLLEAEKAGVPVFTVYLDTLENALKMSNVSPTLTMNPPPGLIFPGTRAMPPTVETLRAEYEIGRLYLNDLVTLSGGRAIPAKNLVAGSEKTIFEAIGEELRLQYRLTFQPSETKPDGARAQIKVRVNRPHLTVLARGSYISGAQAQSSTGK